MFKPADALRKRVVQNTLCKAKYVQDLPFPQTVWNRSRQE